MRFQIPFTFSDLEILKRKSKNFMRYTSTKKTALNQYLKNAGVNIEKREYLAIVLKRLLYNLLIFSVVFSSILGILRAKYFYIFGLGASMLISGFIFFSQRNYPKIYSLNKQRDIEKNLIPVLQDMMVQLNSGVPIFRILVNISEADYGIVSAEFKKVVKEINSGVSQIDAIEKYAKINTSKYFRRVLWQISNGMRSGSDMSIVIDEEIKSLSEEQAIQIQSYGSKLNPLIVFYMIIAIILPSLGITFLIIISSLLGIEESIIKVVFFLIFAVVIFIQIMFLGIIKSRRPSLL
ncbi:type II secretion system F family protein [Candidatus Pacearchaeota archaeon]|nr:type II secretion system F family protein [Candidatus Pacearchaeota archaeon]